MNDHNNENFEESIVFKQTVNFHFHRFALEAKALHVILSVDYHKAWYIPNRIANTRNFPLSTYHRCDVRHII